jgi:hypothetical protein
MSVRRRRARPRSGTASTVRLALVAGAIWLGLGAPARAHDHDHDHDDPGTGRAGAGALGRFIDPVGALGRIAELSPIAPIAPATSPAAPPARACASDGECPDETICEASRCVHVEHRVNVFFLYYQAGTFREVLGLYWSKRGPSGYTFLAPIYWNTFAPTSRSRIVAPFYWHFEDDLAHKTTTVIVPGLPVSWSRQPGAHSFGLWPIFYASSKFGWAAPLLLSFDIADPDRGKSWGAITPLYWWSHTPRSSFDLGIPLFVSVRSPASAFTYALPLNFYRRSGTGWFTLGFPLWWSAGDTASGWRFQLLVPLFFWNRGEHGRSFTLVTPLGGYSRDDQAGSHTLTLWPLLSFFRRDPVRALDIVTPLFIRNRNHEEDSTTRLIAAIIYLRDDPAGSTSVLFPLLWSFRDAATQSSGTVFFPFGYHRSGPDGKVTYAGVFPLWFFHRQLVDGGSSTGLFPLVFFGHKRDASHAVVFPLFWHFADARSSASTLLPVFFATRGPRGRSAGIFPLLAFWGERPDGKAYQVQFPLFWRFADARAGSSTTVTPLGFYGASPEGWRLGVGPVLPLVWIAGGGPRRHLVLFPLLWHFADDRTDQSSTLVTLFFHRRRGNERTDALFPLIYYRRGARVPGLDETSFTLFPLVHYRRDATTRLLVTPVGASVVGPRRAAGFVGPYLWYRGPTFEARGIPFVYADVLRKDTQERTRQFGPFVALDAPGRTSRVLLPLWGRYRDEHETDTYVFPSYFRQRRTDGYAVDTFLPVFWHSEWEGHRATVIGPWYDRRAPFVHDTGFAPLYFWAKNADRTLLVLPFLLTVHRHDFRSGARLTWVGPVVHTSSPDAAGSDRTVVFPLWWSGHTHKLDGKLRTHRILAPLYWHFADADARPSIAADARTDAVRGSSSTLLGPFYGSTHGTTRLRALLPVAWYSHDDADGSGSQAVMPLFYAAEGPKRFTLLTLLGGISRSPTTSRWYAGILYFSDTTLSRTRVLFPFYLGHYDKPSETTTRVIVPLLHFARSDPRKSLSTTLALFWRRTDVTSATTLVLPLFYDVLDYRQKRLTMLLPLFLRQADEVTHETTWLVPLFYSHVAPTESTHVLFPLVWDFKREDRRTTLVLPFFAHWTRATHSGTYVFPNIYYRKGFAAEVSTDGERRPDGTWRLLIPPFFEAAVARPGDFRWEVLGGLFGKERIGRNHYLKLFFFTIAAQKAAPAQTSWYGLPARPSRTRPVRGLAINTW